MIDNDEIFLDSKFSLSRKIWLNPKKNIQKLATNFQQVSPISYPLALFLAQKEITVDQIDTFLNPKIKSSMPDPNSLLDIDKAIKIIVETIQNKRRIAIFADYDVDGAAAAAMLYKWFNNFKLKPTIYIPDRDKEGY